MAIEIVITGRLKGFKIYLLGGLHMHLFVKPQNHLCVTKNLYYIEVMYLKKKLRCQPPILSNKDFDTINLQGIGSLQQWWP